MKQNRGSVREIKDGLKFLLLFVFFSKATKKNIKEGIIKDLKAENNNNQGVERRTGRRTRKAREKVRYKSM